MRRVYPELTPIELAVLLERAGYENDSKAARAAQLVLVPCIVCGERLTHRRAAEKEGVSQAYVSRVVSKLLGMMEDAA